jgi:iron complex transport system ATP-binding protein
VNPLLEARQVGVAVGELALVREFSLTVHEQNFIAILGPNGAGKSTALRAMSGDARFTGEVQLLGKSLDRWSIKQLAEIRAVLPQSSVLSFSFTAEQVVRFGRQARPRAGRSFDERALAQAMQWCEVAHLAQRLYPSLSGGEKARVQCARVLAQLQEPNAFGGRLLFLDEPTAALDLKHQRSVLQAAQRFAQQAGCAVVAVLHDINLAAHFANWIVWMQDGQCVAQGPVQEMLTAAWVERVYGVEAVELTHPRSGVPLVVAA